MYRFLRPASLALGMKKKKQIKMVAESEGVNLMLVLTLMEADDSVVENEMLLGDNDSTLLFTAVIPFMRRNLNRVEGFFTDTLPTYSMDEFKGHFRMTKGTCEALVREIVATGNIPVGNRFGRKSIDPTKQVMIYLWCMANQEVTRLVADRFNVTLSSVTRILERVTKALLRLRRQQVFFTYHLFETCYAFSVIHTSHICFLTSILH